MGMMEGNNLPALEIRPATEEDVPALCGLIARLAEYEGRTAELGVKAASLRHWLFERGTAAALLGEEAGQPVGYAVYYPVFSSFAGAGRLYVEDVFVLGECRGRGYGRQLLAAVAAMARREGYAGLQWSCLDWNEPAIGFYHALGAKRKPASLTFVLDGDSLEALEE